MWRARLDVTESEERLTPSLTIIFDYRYDSSGFFADAGHRAELEQAGEDLTSRIENTPLAIEPGSGNNWSALFFSPATGQQISLPNLSVPEGEIVVFVAGRDFQGEAGEGGPGGYSISGSAAWQNRVGHRGLSGFSLWGGSIGFDIASNSDLYTVATHELGHVLGFGSNPVFNALVDGQYFSGAETTSVNGGTRARLSYDHAHFAANTLSYGRPVSMQPYLQPGRHGFTDLDYAVLEDLGWSITPATTASINAGSPSVAALSLSGVANGSYSLFGLSDVGPVSIGNPMTPFADYFGSLRTVLADVNGDGAPDVIAATGVGGPSRIMVLDGTTNRVLLPSFAVFGNEFTGGLFVAAADFDGDGAAEIIVSPDRGGGGRVSVLNVSGTRVGDFFGIEDVYFRGGARVAAADINGDGTPDLIVGAGFGGGPRVALFDGLTISQSKPVKYVGDFFAFPGDDALALRNGVYVAAGDLNGDGRADLVFGAGPGGGPRVIVLDSAQILAGRLDETRLHPLANFFAFDSSDRGGVQVAFKQIDSSTPILIASNSAQQTAKGFRGLSETVLWALALSGPLDGVFVG